MENVLGEIKKFQANVHFGKECDKCLFAEAHAVAVRSVHNVIESMGLMGDKERELLFGNLEAFGKLRERLLTVRDVVDPEGLGATRDALSEISRVRQTFDGQKPEFENPTVEKCSFLFNERIGGTYQRAFGELSEVIESVMKNVASTPDGVASMGGISLLRAIKVSAESFLSIANVLKDENQDLAQKMKDLAQKEVTLERMDEMVESFVKVRANNAEICKALDAIGEAMSNLDKKLYSMAQKKEESQDYIFNAAFLGLVACSAYIVVHFLRH